MSHLSIPALARKTSYSRRQLQRMAADGLIPGASRTAGGHWRISDGPHLQEWLVRMSIQAVPRIVREKLDPLRVAGLQFANRLDTVMLDTIAATKLPPDELEAMLKHIKRRVDGALTIIAAKRIAREDSSSGDG